MLITGGSEGIGRGLAARFLKAGADVLITGRYPEKLRKTTSELPGVKTLVNDIGKAEEREKLAVYLEAHLPGMNILVNNAGIQRRVGLAADRAPWSDTAIEIDILLAAPLDDFIDKVFPQLIKKGTTTVGYGPTENLVPELSERPVEKYFKASAARNPVERY